MEVLQERKVENKRVLSLADRAEVGKYVLHILSIS